ncbi:high mobility group box domain-containing protein, partial [Cerioporus squamosus]
RIPRPPNAFILYRNYTAEKIRILHKQRTVQSKIVSMVAGHAWRLESEEVKMEFHRMAEAAKQEHRLRYPEYHFEPQK